VSIVRPTWRAFHRISRLTLEAITKNGRQVALVTDPDDRLLRHRDRRRADRDVAEGLLD